MDGVAAGRFIPLVFGTVLALRALGSGFKAVGLPIIPALTLTDEAS